MPGRNIEKSENIDEEYNRGHGEKMQAEVAWICEMQERC